MITIIAVGRQHDTLLKEAIGRYEKRLKKPFTLEWILIPHSLFEGTRAAEEESERIQKRLDSQDYVVVLDERGELLDSPAFSHKLSEVNMRSKRIVCVIGGAYGVSEALRRRADLVWSLSKLVFPHQFVRLILVEQIYRAQAIARGEPYHHE